MSKRDLKALHDAIWRQIYERQKQGLEGDKLRKQEESSLEDVRDLAQMEEGANVDERGNQDLKQEQRTMSA